MVDNYLLTAQLRVNQYQKGPAIARGPFPLLVAL